MYKARQRNGNEMLHVNDIFLKGVLVSFIPFFIVFTVAADCRGLNREVTLKDFHICISFLTLSD